MPADPLDIQAVALLDEPVRRTLYERVIRADHSVGRDEAAAGAGISRALAAFHLDRLVRAGLLAVEFRRLSGRTGPGAGRPAKLYRRGPRHVAVSVPHRQYELPASLFASALEQSSGPIPPLALSDTAREEGRAAGMNARSRARSRPGRRRLDEALRQTLAERGYEPVDTESNEIRFRNCPFDALVDDHRDLVCGMNLALTEGILDGLGDERREARLDPQPGLCCVAISLAARAGGQR